MMLVELLMPNNFHRGMFVRPSPFPSCPGGSELCVAQGCIRVKKAYVGFRGVLLL